MILREATIKDVENIQELIALLGYQINLPDLTATIEIYKQRGYIQVAIINEKAVGFITALLIPLFHAKENMCRITALSVHSSHKRHGIGKKLVNAVEEWSLDNDCFYLEVTSGEKRKDEAHLFYGSLGYTVYPGARFQKRIKSKTFIRNADH